MNRPRAYLDANVFIAAYENERAPGNHAWRLLTAIEDGEFAGVTSELTLAEILVRPLQQGDYDLAQRYQSVISPSIGFDVAAVDRAVLIEAAALRGARKSLRLPDAIHVATARLSACACMVSDDRRLPLVPGLGMIRLGPHALDAIRGQDR